MTTDSAPAGGDPRSLLSDVRTLAHRVRLDQRVTWFPLLVLAAATYIAVPIDWFGMQVDCTPDGACHFDRKGFVWYWPFALLIAYTLIAACYIRVARNRGVGARILPYAVTGAIGAAVFSAAAILVRLYFAANPVPENAPPTPEWVLLFDRLIAPSGTIGIALLVLARLERNLALLAFTIGYLAVVLIPVNFGWVDHSSTRAEFLPQQIINGTVLLLGAAGFALTRRRSNR
ncbi:hypothetical protein AB0M02_22025 [Actinoplanes sp. NPDC051861]|uniref:hypothetical protein n=1 Tax=Actinoplanes sp. NPDC051861 TaxID=3155170 RepID=UPI0034327E42